MKGRIVRNRWLRVDDGDDGGAGRGAGAAPGAPALRELWLEAPEAAREARPGQFLHLRLGEEGTPLLRRALTPVGIDRERGALRLAVRPGGRALGRLALRGEGEEVDFLGPLGRPFPLPAELERPLLVAEGGAWLALWALAEELDRRGLRPGILLAGEVDAAVEAEIRRLGALDKVAGGHGPEGRAAALAAAAARAAERIAEGVDALYAAGSEQLLIALRAAATEARGGAPLPAWAALEGAMACGIGSCLGCAVLLREGAPGGPRAAGAVRVARLCTEGPVFELERLALGESWPREEEVAGA
ncbi:MAG: hypothetical protein QJR14_00460 [Bacillota bacterium]|nr:hypothetical protein [Bacillota bacterium]